jgi:hypothetical protein
LLFFEEAEVNTYRHRACTLFLALLCLFLTGLPLHAQSDTSSLSGTVADASGAVVPSANITLNNQATRAEIHATTNSSGSYTITNLPTGAYTMRVEAPGFQTTNLSDIRVDPNIGRRIDVTMRVGDTTTSVTVEANANTVQT